MTETFDSSWLVRLQRLDSCAISDALDTLQLRGAVTGIKPLWAVNRTVIGRVRTVTVGPKQADKAADHVGAKAIEQAENTDVLVIANSGREDVSCFGGTLATAATLRGIRGVVIDGACRDIADSEALDFPVFGRAVVPVSARGRIVQLDMNEPVEFAGVTVDSADLVIADRNGIAFIPQQNAEEVIDMAERITEREAKMVQAVRAGERVSVVMHDSKFPSVKDAES